MKHINYSYFIRSQSTKNSSFFMKRTLKIRRNQKYIFVLVLLLVEYIRSLQVLQKTKIFNYLKINYGSRP